MRRALLLAASLSFILAGGTCLPITDDAPRAANTGETLAIAVTRPSEDKLISQGQSVRIQWTGSNLTGDPASVDILLESRLPELETRTFIEDQPFVGTGDGDIVDWDTSNDVGPFRITGRIQTATLGRTHTAPGTITIFGFVEPSEDVVLPRDGESIEIEWFGGDDKENAVLMLSPESGLSDITIAEPPVNIPTARQSFSWSGTDDTGNPVAPGLYTLSASNSSSAEETFFDVEATNNGVAVNVGVYGFTNPDEDTDLDPAEGDTIDISLFAGGEGAEFTVGLDPDSDHRNGNEIPLAILTLNANAEEQTFTFDGTDIDGIEVAAGTYSLYGSVFDPAAGPYLVEARGDISIQGLATFEFTAPTEDQTFDHDEDDPEAIRIEWFGGGVNATARIGLDPDDDHENGNEVYFTEQSLLSAPDDQSTTFTGTRLDGRSVLSDTYNLIAEVSDDDNDPFFAEGLAQIIVTGTPPGPAILAPRQDTDLIGLGDTIEIEYQVDQEDEVRVDLLLDPDDDRNNGNEVSLLVQEEIEPDTDPQQFTWDGTNAAGDDVESGIYTLLLEIRQEDDSTEAVEGSGKIFRRGNVDQPLISLLTPTSDQTVVAGDEVTIRWRYDTSSDNAEVVLKLERLSDSAEITIPGGTRTADPDDDEDRFIWTVPSRSTLPDLEPGSYYLKATITAGGLNDTATAAGLIVVDDPEGN